MSFKEWKKNFDKKIGRHHNHHLKTLLAVKSVSQSVTGKCHPLSENKISQTNLRFISI